MKAWVSRQGYDDVTRFGVHILETLEARLASIAEAKVPSEEGIT